MSAARAGDAVTPATATPTPADLDARLAQAQADLAGDPDPFAEVPDAGDFGLARVEGPVRTTAGSLTEDSYMDQPDVGSTGTYSADTYGTGIYGTGIYGTDTTGDRA